MTAPANGAFWRVVLIWCAGLGAAAQYGKVSVTYDLLGSVYTDAGPQLGFAVSLVGFTGILFGVVAGVLVSAIGYRRAMIWGLILGAVISLYQSSLPSMPFLLGSRIVEGFSHLAIVVAAPTLIAAISTDTQRNFALTLWGTFFGVAFALLAVAGVPFARPGKTDC